MTIKKIDGTTSDNFTLGSDKEATVKIVRGPDNKLYLEDTRHIGEDKLIPIDISDLDDVPTKPATGSKILAINEGVITWGPSPDEVQSDSREPHGFCWTALDAQESTISWDDVTRTLLLTAVDTEYCFYVKAIKFCKASDTKQIADIEGPWWFYYDNTGTLQASQIEPNYSLNTIVYKLYWNATDKKIEYTIDSRHGLSMDSKTYSFLQRTDVEGYVDGLEIGDYIIDGDGTLDAHATYSLTDGLILNQDIDIPILDGVTQELSPITQAGSFYFTGTSPVFRSQTATNFSIISDTGIPQWNENIGTASSPNWQLSNVLDNYYFCAWVMALPNENSRIVFVPGQYMNDNLNESITDNFFGKPALENMFPNKEFEFISMIVFKYKTTYTNTPKCTIQSVINLRLDSVKTVFQIIQRTVLPVTNNGNDYIAHNSTTPLVACSFAYTGKLDRVLSTFKVTVSRSGTIGSATIILYDYTNNNEICRIDDITTDIKHIRNNFNLQNLPNNEAVLEVQILKNTTQSKNIQLHCIEVY